MTMNNSENTFFEAFMKGRKLGQHHPQVNLTLEQLVKSSKKPQNHDEGKQGA